MSRSVLRLLLCSVVAFSHVGAAVVFWQDHDKVTLGGYDPVSYFEAEEPQQGIEELQVRWQGVIWRFANENFRGLFIQDPLKYAPQYGGFCAFAMAYGKAVKADPLVFEVYNGRLYLNVNAEAQQKWQQNRDQYVLQANYQWNKLTR